MTKRIVYSLYYFECGFTSFTLVITNRTPIQIERKEKKEWQLDVTDLKIGELKYKMIIV